MDFLHTLLEIFGAIGIIGGGVAVIWKWVTPAIKLNKRVEVVEDRIETIEGGMKNAIKNFGERDALMLEAMITMIDSQISGNNIEELKKTRKKISEYLIRSQACG